MTPQLAIPPCEDTVRQVLSERFGSFVHKSILESALYGEGPRPQTNTVEVFIMRLRKRGFAIETSRGEGYKLLALARNVEGETQAP